jgi:hypothetical protein
MLFQHSDSPNMHWPRAHPNSTIRELYYFITRTQPAHVESMHKVLGDYC